MTVPGDATRCAVELGCECTREAFGYLRMATRERKRVEERRRLATVGEGEIA